jgi:hypothetical protein
MPAVGEIIRQATNKRRSSTINTLFLGIPQNQKYSIDFAAEFQFSQRSGRLRLLIDLLLEHIGQIHYVATTVVFAHTFDSYYTTVVEAKADRPDLMPNEPDHEAMRVAPD